MNNPFAPYTLCVEEYPLGEATAILINDPSGSLVAKLSVNVPTYGPLPIDCFFAKEYSENERLAPFILSAKIPCVSGLLPAFEPTGIEFPQGYVTLKMYRLTHEGIYYLFNETYNPRSDIYEASTRLFDLHALLPSLYSPL